MESKAIPSMSQVELLNSCSIKQSVNNERSTKNISENTQCNTECHSQKGRIATQIVICIFKAKVAVAKCISLDVYQFANPRR